LIQAGFPPKGGKSAFFCAGMVEVFPPEPPVAMIAWPERRTAVKGAPQFGAA